jgi:hypothetical protein
LGPAAYPFYSRICRSLSKDPATLSAGDLETFAGHAYTAAKRSLDEQTAWSLYNRLLALKN